MSNYLWDAQHQQANPSSVNIGFWANPQQFAKRIAGQNRFTKPTLEFIAGGTIHNLYTTGCNIPIFVAAHVTKDIVPIKKPHPKFEWHNYFDKDDVLGWPLEDLSSSYRTLVTDHKINVGQGVIGRLLKSWNPLSHNEYWRDSKVLDDLVVHLKLLL